MDLIKIKNILDDIEDKYDVEKWYIDDISIWTIQRIYFATLLQNEGVALIKQNMINRICSHIKILLRNIFFYFRDYKKNDCSKNENVIFFGYNHNRNFQLKNGEYYNIHMDPFMDLCKENDYTVKLFENNPSCTLRYPRYSPSVLTYLSFRILKIKSVFFSKCTLKKTSLPRYELFLKEMERKGLSVKLLSIKDLALNVYYINQVRKYFIKMINKKTVKIGICVDSASLEGKAFILACRDIGIPAVEIQHGVIGESHYAFGSWKCKNGYTVLPDYFWCWDKYAAKVINSWAGQTNGKHRALVGGNLWHYLWRVGNKSFVRDYDKFFYDLKKKSIMESQCKVILLTLQPRIAYDEFVYDMIAKTKEKYWWIIRLHPTMANKSDIYNIQNKFGQFKNVYIDIGDKIPILIWLKNIDLHVTFDSSVIIEAASWGVKSIILDTSNLIYDYYKEQIQSKMAVIARNEAEFSDLVKKMSCRSEKSAEVNFKKPIDLLKRIINEKR